MIITISGTPGTGKTPVAKKLAEDVGYEYHSLTDIVEKNDLGTKDEERDTIEVDPNELGEFVNDMGLTNAVIDGLMAYAVHSDVCIVLRCNPTELRRRLETKGWKKEKIDENIEAETIGYVIVEALERNEQVFEVDTTNLPTKEIVKICGHIIANRDSKYLAGKIDWME